MDENDEEKQRWKSWKIKDKNSKNRKAQDKEVGADLWRRWRLFMINNKIKKEI